MWSIHVIAGTLSFIAFFNISNGENQVAVSVSSTCVLSGTNVSCWGYGGYGVLGTGSTSDLYEPPTSPIDLGDDFMTAAIDCGFAHCCGVSTNKTLKCWGMNRDGQLGQGDTNNRGDVPGEMGNNLSIIDLGTDFDVEQVICGSYHTCVLSTNQNIKCFGNNWYGQLGYGNTDHIGDDENEMGGYLSVISLGIGFIPIQVDCGYYHSCALSADHQIKCWGWNYDGQLGQGDTMNKGDGINQMGDNLTPIDLGTGFNASTVRCGAFHVCALSTDHDTKCWGENYYGQLGLGDTYHRGVNGGEMGDDLPALDVDTDFTSQLVGGGDSHNLVLSADGEIKAWGSNHYGQLGYGDTNYRGNEGNEMGSNLPLIDVGHGFIVTDISSGCCSTHSCALLENGTDFLGLKCWGRNVNGRLGLGDTLNRGDGANEMGDNLPFVSAIFPALPTPLPTTEPTTQPTVPTTNLTNEPTGESIQTTSIAPSVPSTNAMLIAAILASFVCISSLICGAILWKQYPPHNQMIERKAQPNKRQMFNGLIAKIAIGSYDTNQAMLDNSVQHLEVEDIINDLSLLGDDLGYDYISLNDKRHWTEQDILAFLRDDVGAAFFDENGSPKYDGLILSISSYGDERNVLSSDYQVIEKTAIHRIISNKYAPIRDFPRIFVFETRVVPHRNKLMISQSERTTETEKLTRKQIVQRHVVAAQNQDEDGKVVKMVMDKEDQLKVTLEVGKNTSLEDVREVNEWTPSTKNPDYNLVTVNAIGDAKTPNVIHYLAQKLRRNITNREGLGLSDIMGQVEKDLAEGENVHCVSIFYNETRTMVIQKKQRK